MKNSKKGKFEFIDFKGTNEISRDKSQSSYLNMNKQVKNDHFSQLNQQPPIKISPFNNLKQSMPFCYANYSMMNNHSNWLNSDEEASLKNKLQSDSTVSQMITVDCGGSTTTTQIASSTASSCSLPVNVNEGSDKLTPNDYECYKPSSPMKTNKTKSTSLLNTIDNQLTQNLLDNKKSNSGLSPLTLEWTNLSCEISTRKSFISNIFNCFIANDGQRHIYNNSESSSLNDLNQRDSEASSYRLEQSIKKKKDKKLILDRQSGQFVNGTINAIIGASGAGKSTLLECISGRRIHGVEGTVNVYSNTEIFGKNVTLAYLGQNESLINVLTVKEVLLFSSRLKNYRKIKTYEQHLKLVNSIISEFKLECCANNYVHSISGGQLKRVAIASELISGPDIILLDEPTSGLDSCTAYTCIKLLRKITGLADHQQQFRAPIVICSIHQPSIQLLNEFHNLYVLSNNGRCIYQGQPQKMIQYLNKFNLQCPKYYDPVNFIIQIASGYYGFDVIHLLAEQERILQEQRTMELQDNLFIKTNICGNPFKNYNHYTDAIYDIVGGNASTKLEQYVESKLYCGSKNKKLMKFSQSNQISQTVSHFHQLPHIKTIKISSIIEQMKSQSFPFFYHTLLLTKRTYFGTIREPKLTWLRVFQALFIGFLMSFLYDHPIGKDSGCWSESKAIKEIFNPSNPANENIKFIMNMTNNSTEPNYQSMTRLDDYINQNKLNHQLNSKANTYDNVAFVFFVTLFLVMSSMMPTVLTFPSEVRTMQAERLNGYYSVGSYYVAKWIADTPFIIFNAILFCCIVYPLTGQLLEFKIFALFTFVAIVAALIAHCIGQLFGTIYVHSVTSAVFMAPLSMSPVFLFSGFFGKITSLPLFLKPVAYASYVRYCFECFLISLYGFDRCKITHNRTFFLHRYLHNMTLFNKEKDLFFGNVAVETTESPNLLPNAEALVQRNPFNNPFNVSSLNLLPESSRSSLLSSNLNPNELFRNFSSLVDKNLLDKLQLQNFFKNNTISLPGLLSSTTTEASNLSMNKMNNDLNIIQNKVSTNLSNVISNSMSTVSNSLTNSLSNSISNSIPSSLTNSLSNSISNSIPSISNSLSSTLSTTLSTTTTSSISSFIENATTHFDILTPVNNSTSITANELLTNQLDLNATSISSFSINSIDLLNENEINQHSFSDLPNSLVLEFYNINDEIFWKNIIFLTVIYVFLRLLAYAILVVKTNRFK